MFAKSASAVALLLARAARGKENALQHDHTKDAAPFVRNGETTEAEKTA